MSEHGEAWEIIRKLDTQLSEAQNAYIAVEADNLRLRSAYGHLEQARTHAEALRQENAKLHEENSALRARLDDTVQTLEALKLKYHSKANKEHEVLLQQAFYQQRMLAKKK